MSPPAAADAAKAVVDAALGIALEEMRIRRGFTQARLAKVAGVSRRHVASAMKGANISVLVLRKLLKALGGSVMISAATTDLTVGLLTISPDLLAAVMRDLERSISILLDVRDTIRPYAGEQTSGNSALTKKAAKLVEKFAKDMAERPEDLAAIDDKLSQSVLPGEVDIPKRRVLRR